MHGGVFGGVKVNAKMGTTTGGGVTVGTDSESNSKTGQHYSGQANQAAYNAVIKAGKEMGLSDAQAKEYADDIMKTWGGAKEAVGGVTTAATAYGFLGAGYERLAALRPSSKATGAINMASATPTPSITSSITSSSLNKSPGMPSSSYVVVGEASSGGILSNVKNIVKGGGVAALATYAAEQSADFFAQARLDMGDNRSAAAWGLLEMQSKELAMEWAQPFLAA